MQVFYGGEVVGVNPKINNMQPGYKSAKHELIMVSDSGIRSKQFYALLIKECYLLLPRKPHFPRLVEVIMGKNSFFNNLFSIRHKAKLFESCTTCLSCATYIAQKSAFNKRKL